MAKILIIGDDQDQRTMVQFVLEREGYECVIATSIQEATSHLKSLDINVIFLDLPLGSEPDGWDFYIELKTDPNFYRIPAVVYTSRIYKESLPNPSDYGDQLFTKPMDIQKLLEVIEGFLHSS